MNDTFLSAIEDALRKLATPHGEDPRAAPLAAREHERAERDPHRRSAVPADPDAGAHWFLHEPDWEPNLAAVMACQHWAAPYDTDYLLVTLPAVGAFKPLDVLALSPREDLSYEDLKAALADEQHQTTPEIVQASDLRGRPWLTSLPADAATAGGALYLHCFYATKGRPGEDTVAHRAARRQVLVPGAALPRVENPHNEGGKARVAQPAIAPGRVPLGRGEAAGTARVAAGASLPFRRLFLSLTPEDEGYYPWLSFVQINVELTPGVTPDQYDYIALATKPPTGPKDYWTYQNVSDLDQGAYATTKECDKWLNWNLSVADLETLETLYVFYGGWVNGVWAIIGDPVSYKRQKHWMTESLPDIGQKRLTEIVIPGAHDAGTYDMVSKGFMLNAQAQNLDFDGQLALGIRYFDCRLEYFPKSQPSQPFFFYHGGATYTGVTELLGALRRFFVNDNSKDIVILDFCRPWGFDAAAYDKLFELFTTDPFFANAMMTPEEAAQLTIEQLVARGRRLFVLCEDVPARIKYNLGKSINLDAQWAHTSKLSDLKAWLDNQVAANAGAGQLWSLQAILTPVAVDSLSSYAVELFPVLEGWIVNEWWNKANVVMCDFTAGTDIVHAAKAANRLRDDKAKGDLFWYEQPNGQGAPMPAATMIGNGGWTNFKAVHGASEGWIYAVDWNSSLQRYQYLHWSNGSGPMANPRQTMKTTTPTQWLDYRLYFSSSVGAAERWVYAVTGNYMSDGTGKLWRWKDTGGDTLGAGQQIDSGWENYRIAFASSDGAIYAIDHDNLMWRWQDSGSGTLQPATRISAGWERWKTAFASSGGLIYGVDWDGNMWQWQDSGSGPLPDGQQRGAGWGGFRMMLATSDGRFYGIRD